MCREHHPDQGKHQKLRVRPPQAVPVPGKKPAHAERGQSLVPEQVRGSAAVLQQRQRNHEADHCRKVEQESAAHFR